MIDHDAEIERILGGPPSKLAFRALAAAVTRAGSPEHLLALCDERLASWPDEVREAPWSWLAALEAGHSKPVWRLVRSLPLKSRRPGVRDVQLPDPRSRSEVRGVTGLDLGWFAHDALAALNGTFAHWDNLRSVRTELVTLMDGEVIAELAGNEGLRRLESLNLVNIREDMFHFEKPPFRPPAGPPWQLRHAGLRAPDLVHLMRSGLVPRLRSADVLVCDVDEARDLAGCAELAGLDRLAIGFRCGKKGLQPAWAPYFGNVIEQDDQAAEVFFGQADLSNLRALTVRGYPMGLGREGLGARGMAAVVASGVLRQLTELTVELLPVDDAAVAGVLGGIDPERIEELTLADLVATDQTAAAFVAVPAFPRLRHLDLGRNRLTEKGAQQLATDVQLPALEYLDLSGREGGSPYYGRPDVQPIGDLGAQAWASSDNAAKLTYLNLGATGLGTDGLVALMRSERLGRLETLELNDNPMGSWPAVLRDAPVWRTLRTLNLTECGLGDDDVEALTSTASAPVLTSISLAYNSIGPRGVAALTSWAVLPQLWEMNLHDNPIGDDGLARLAGSRAAQRLLELDLELDCWSANARYDTRLPAEVLDQASFPRLDTIFLGIVDEYHGARYSSGFSAQLREAIAASSDTRPALVAFLTHLEVDEDEVDEDAGDEEPESTGERSDRDFRGRRATNHAQYIEDARDFARRMVVGDIGWPPPDRG